MLAIVKKLGGYENTHNILKSMGIICKKTTLFIQSYRGKMSSRFSLALMDYCQKHNIPVSIEDFKA